MKAQGRNEVCFISFFKPNAKGTNYKGRLIDFTTFNLISVQQKTQ